MTKDVIIVSVGGSAQTHIHIFQHMYIFSVHFYTLNTWNLRFMSRAD